LPQQILLPAEVMRAEPFGKLRTAVVEAHPSTGSGRMFQQILLPAAVMRAELVEAHCSTDAVLSEGLRRVFGAWGSRCYSLAERMPIRPNQP
jgi:hypothetical protein